MVAKDLVTYPTWERYIVLSHVILTLSVRDRRKIFQLCRQAGSHGEAFFPEYGITFSEFAVWYTLGDKRRKCKR